MFGSTSDSMLSGLLQGQSMSEAGSSKESGINSTVMTSAAAITIVIAGTHPALAELERLVRTEDGLSVVGVAANAKDTIKVLERLDPDVLVLDLEMDDAAAAVRRKNNRTNVVLWIAPEDKNQIAQAIKLGCSGIALKQAAANLILDCIRVVHRGNVWLDPQVATAMADFAPPPSCKPRRSGAAGLSEREQQIVQLVSQGYKNSAIAQHIHISEQTVKNHLHSIFNKVGVSDRLDLALYAVHKGWHLNGKPTARPHTGAAPVIIRPLEKQH